MEKRNTEDTEKVRRARRSCRDEKTQLRALVDEAAEEAVAVPFGAVIGVGYA